MSMEPLGEILKGMELEGTDEYDDPGGREPACSTCRDLKWVRHEVQLNHPDFGKAFPCPDCPDLRDRQQGRYDRMQRELPAAQRDNTFDSLDPRRELAPGSLKLYRAAARDAQAIGKHESSFKWLVLAGNPGWGKTHLAVCACNYRIDHPDLRLPGFSFVNVPNMLAHLRAGYEEDSDGSYEERIQGYLLVPLLVVDDVGAESGTAWAHEQLYRVLNHRYIEAMETIITTNVPIVSLGSRIGDRLLDERSGLVKVHDLRIPSIRSGRTWR
jgi:DNA replication protein DnaC